MLYQFWKQHTCVQKLNGREHILFSHFGLMLISGEDSSPQKFVYSIPDM